MDQARVKTSTRWLLLSLAIAVLVCLPILSVVYLAFNPSENIWPHLLDTVLGHYLSTTLVLMLCVSVGTMLMGVTTAVLVTHYEFPGRSLASWALLLPFAVPAYVIAYVYTDLLDYAGPVQSILREWFGWQSARDYWFPKIRTLPGAALMFTLVLYPYVYLLARAAFLEQSASVQEAARLLGVSRLKRFFLVTFPIARPAIVVGVAMALMETLNDFGTVDYFAVKTLTAGIYDVWLGMNNLGGGAQIASLLLSFVAVLFVLEKFSRRHQQHFQSVSRRFQRARRTRLRGLQAALATCACAIPILLGFGIPAIVLTRYAIRYFDVSWNSDFLQIAWNSIALSSAAALIAVGIGILLSYSLRLNKHPLLTLTSNLSRLGYAVPGAVLAIGIIVPFAAFDNTLDAMSRQWFGISTGLLLSGTVFALIFAYIVRFLAVAFGGIDAAMNKISSNMDDAARSLGRGTGSILWNIHIPLIRSSLLSAALVVFVDCMKELPATLVLRPFNFDTLATHVYQYASDELLGESALAALLIVAVGLIPVILLSRSIDRSARGVSP
ncbi:MAG: iron ABC transporter permease [Gammaproteobacteria bacterium]|nr:iron ABC transporter permease [Gammaproteobacteria bacterium]